MTWHPIIGDPHTAFLAAGLGPGDGVGVTQKGLFRRASDRRIYRLTVIKYSALGVMGRDESAALLDCPRC